MRPRRKPAGIVFRAGARLINGVASAIWPQRSLVTGDELAGPGALEPELWAKLQFLAPPWCACCGTAFDIAVEPGQLCAACLVSPPRYDMARAPLAYGDVARDMVLALKRQGRRDGLALMARWMAKAGAEALADARLITPVPLHYLRLVRRGFNQSGWLAAALGRETGIPVSPDALKRIKATPSQAGKTADGRRRNVEGAFRVRALARRRVAGGVVVLVDDVMTTGATVEACALALKRAGASRVHVLTLARVAGPRTPPI